MAAVSNIPQVDLVDLFLNDQGVYKAVLLADPEMPKAILRGDEDELRNRVASVIREAVLQDLFSKLYGG